MAIVLDKKGQTHNINLTKVKDAINLTKGNDAINLNKGKISTEMRINLNWSGSKGFLSKLFGSNVDLDLGCYYRLTDGTRNVIDGLQFAGNRGGKRNQRSLQGSYTLKPYIWHTGDDRTGSSETGETILVNPAGFALISQIIVYTFIYEGVPKWGDTNAVVTIKVPGNEDIIINMDEYDTSKNFCALAQIDFHEDKMSVEKLMTFHDGHEECDRAYHWGLAWGQGSK